MFFCSTHLKQGGYFDYWNQTLNVRMRVCYLDFFISKNNCKYKKGLGNVHLALCSTVL
jgi:hypothetical protein